MNVRDGTKADEKSLQHTFRELKFNNNDIILKQNRTHWQILEDIKEAANKVTKDHSSLFVIIMSHGQKGGILQNINYLSSKIYTYIYYFFF